jgi:hypothetical protein
LPSGRAIDWSSLGFPHPNSPAGRLIDWSSLGFPHPNSPAGRLIDWPSALARKAQEKHEYVGGEIDELERFLAKQSAIFRDNLPDTTLREIYNSQIDRIKASTGLHDYAIDHDRATHRVKAFVEILRAQVYWFNVNLHDLPQLEDFLGIRGNGLEKSGLLNHFRGVVQRCYELTTKSIQKQWVEARRAGRQQELLEQWKRQLLRRLASPGLGAGQSQNAPKDQRSTAAGRPERRSETPTRTPAVVKTWVAIRLIDEDRQPMPNVIYRVKLPDGSLRIGRLDRQGTARFEQIEPGQCEITFTEIDGREWQPI